PRTTRSSRFPNHREGRWKHRPSFFPEESRTAPFREGGSLTKGAVPMKFAAVVFVFAFAAPVHAQFIFRRPPIPISTFLPPSHLHRTGDPAVCIDHLPPFVAIFGGADLCVQSLLAQNAVLVWDRVVSADGYKIYRRDGAIRTLLGSETSG